MTAEPLSTTDSSGADLIEAAKNGVESAWAAIYAELAGPVTGYLRSRGARDPEDLSSEVFYQVARDIHSFDGDGSNFRSWVFVIAHRRLIDARRAAGRRPKIVDEPISADQVTTEDVEAQVISELSTAQVRAIFEQLTDDQKSVLSLRIIGDLTLEETASVMGKRVGAIKALQRRALAAVKTHLERGRVTL